MSNPPTAEEIPTFAECVIGYREWRLDSHDRLWPLHAARRPWSPGVNVARCNCAPGDRLHFTWSVFDGRRVLEADPIHAAPDSRCTCGLYSLRYPSARWSDLREAEASHRAIGAVACWGRMQVHSEGFRSEYACVVAAARPDTERGDYAASLRRMAASYRIELVPLQELEDAAREHGSPLPDALRPALEREMPDRDPEPAPPVGHAPDATIEEVGAPPPKVGFDGQPLPKPLFEGMGPASI